MCRASASRRGSAARRFRRSRSLSCGSRKQVLKRRAHQNGEGDDETIFLQPVIEAAESGKTPADTLLDEYATRWRGLVDPVYVDDAY